LILLLTYSILTGGIYVNNRTHISQRDRPANPTVKIEVLYDFHETHVPLLFHYAAYKRPYRLVMSVFDSRKDFDRIEIDDITMELQSGEIFHGMQNWRRDFREDDWGLSNYSGGVAVYHVYETLDLALPKAEPFSLTVKGRLRTKAGEFIPLNQKMDYQVDRQWLVVPYWLIVFADRMLV